MSFEYPFLTTLFSAKDDSSHIFLVILTPNACARSERHNDYGLLTPSNLIDLLWEKKKKTTSTSSISERQKKSPTRNACTCDTAHYVWEPQDNMWGRKPKGRRSLPRGTARSVREGFVVHPVCKPCQGRISRALHRLGGATQARQMASGAAQRRAATSSPRPNYSLQSQARDR